MFLAGWIASFLMPPGLLFLAVRPATRWQLAMVWGGMLTAPLHALLVKVLLPAIARGRVSYLSALVACACGALVSTAVFMAGFSSPPATAGITGSYFPVLLGVAGLLSAVGSAAVAGMFVWGSAQPTTAARGL